MISNAGPLLFSFRNPLSQLEEEKKEYEERIVKMKDDMEKVFESKVSKKVQRLEDIKSEVSLVQSLFLVEFNELPGSNALPFSFVATAGEEGT